MSFFGNDTPVNGEFNAGGGSFEPIPNNTEVLATADEAKWSEYDGDRYINLKWVVLAPDAYKGRVVFHKLKVCEADEAKAQKARNMLAAIDFNASGGKLVQSGQDPTDETLSQHLCHSPMYLKLMVWKMDINGEEKSGNWIQQVAPKNRQPAQQAEAAPTTGNSDEVPF